MTYIDKTIELDSLVDGIRNPYKIQRVYEEIKEKLGLDQPFMKDEIKSIKHSEKMDLLYGREMYRFQGTIYTFSIYGYFDVIRKILDNKSTNNNYDFATRMEITIRTQDANIEHRIEDIVNKHSSKL